MSWRIPTNVPQTAVSNGHQQLQSVAVGTPLDELFQHWDEDGGVIIKNLMTPAQVDQMQAELEPALEGVQRGSLIDHPELQAFHGRKTKRAGDIVNSSPTFRHQILENDYLHSLLYRVFTEGGHSGNYWMSLASTLNAIGPQPAQVLHRDVQSSPPYVLLGESSTEGVVNFIVALTDFTEENGATRLIPGSNKWPYTQRGTYSQTIPALLRAGDCLFFSGKIVHCMGENFSSTNERKCVQMTTIASFLTPTEAHPLIVKPEIAKKLSPRAQRYLGFRSQYPRQTSGLWLKDYSELGLHLGLVDPQNMKEEAKWTMEEQAKAHQRYPSL